MGLGQRSGRSRLPFTMVSMMEVGSDPTLTKHVIMPALAGVSTSEAFL